MGVNAQRVDSRQDTVKTLSNRADPFLNFGSCFLVESPASHVFVRRNNDLTVFPLDSSECRLTKRAKRRRMDRQLAERTGGRAGFSDHGVCDRTAANWKPSSGESNEHLPIEITPVLIVVSF